MSATAATILHADLDSFFASVEQRDDPALRGRPVIVGGGVVLAASYEAKAYGVRTAMGGRQAPRLCPDAVVVPPRFTAYTEASRAVFEVFDDTTPLVEGISIDEAFLDVGGLRRIAGTPVEIAAQLRRDVRERVGLPITVGVARTKFLAKVASGVAKPDGLLVVPPDGELGVPPPAARRAAVGRRAKTAEKLHARGITTVGDLARARRGPARRDARRAAGRHLHALAHNRDPRPVQAGRAARSIGSQRALGRRRRTADELDADRWSASSTASPAACAPPTASAARSRCGCASTTSPGPPGRTRCPAPTAEHGAVLAVARALLRVGAPLIAERGLTLVGITVGNLDDDGADPARPALRPPRAARSTPPSTTSATASAPGPHPRRAARPRPPAMPMLPVD